MLSFPRSDSRLSAYSPPNLYPAFVLLLTALFLKRKTSAGQLAALVLSFLGCVVTFFAPGSYPLAGLLLATVLPITALFAAMRRSGAANTSLVSTVKPVITILVSSLFLGEELAANRILGGLLIIGGVVMLRLLTMERGRA